ncbi:DUF2913 family protein [Thaumasiovibrio sp. DFM-14]|uniref:DUF2913 family protein n=1 Tax=Thaumasiovibrio sp. DFM-14 TaxID=3384792 RepID=UPI0039A3E04D
MTVIFYQHLLELVESGLSELNASIASGKTSATPVSETYFLSNWVTKAIKQQRFHPSTKQVLIAWQKLSRSQGKNAMLKAAFEEIQRGYRDLLDGRDAFPAVVEAQIQGLVDAVEEADWEVTLEYPILRKVSNFTDGHASMVMCSEQLVNCFDGETLTKPLSVYVRGDKVAFIAMARAQGLLLHKVTDYKSKVKYHGEYVLYPQNNGPIVAELPS